MARYRRVPATPNVSDLRSAPGNGETDATVSVEPASSTTTDESQLTDADIAPEASPAETKPERASKPKAAPKAKTAPKATAKK